MRKNFFENEKGKLEEQISDLENTLQINKALINQLFSGSVEDTKAVSEYKEMLHLLN